MTTATSQSPFETVLAGSFADVAAESAAVPVIAGYELGQRLGAGGMGVVYLAHDRVTGRRRAVKVMKPGQGAAAASRFQFEIAALEQLAHPHIVQLSDRGRTAAGDEFFAMEYLAGENLNVHVERRGPLAARRVIAILRQLCSALGDVHATGLVHGDLKPANIVPAGQGGREVAKLIDFGLARPVGGQADAAGCDAASAFAGSPLFAPPEAVAGAVDARSDIYSLGATAYFLLTGRPVFDESRPLAAILAHAERTPSSVSSVQPSVPAALDAIIMKCLAKNPADRFQSAEELDATLAKAAQSIDTANQHPKARRADRNKARGGAKRSPGNKIHKNLRSPNGAALNGEHEDAFSAALSGLRFEFAHVSQGCAALRPGLAYCRPFRPQCIGDPSATRDLLAICYQSTMCDAIAIHRRVRTRRTPTDRRAAPRASAARTASLAPASPA